MFCIINDQLVVLINISDIGDKYSVALDGEIYHVPKDQVFDTKIDALTNWRKRVEKNIEFYSNKEREFCERKMRQVQLLDTVCDAIKILGYNL